MATRRWRAVGRERRGRVRGDVTVVRGEEIPGAARDHEQESGDAGSEQREPRRAPLSRRRALASADFACAGTPTCQRIDPDRLGDVLERGRAQDPSRPSRAALSPDDRRPRKDRSRRASTMPSSRAAILTPSPIKSPSLSSTTSPKWMPTRNSMRSVRRTHGVALDQSPAALRSRSAPHRRRS